MSLRRERPSKGRGLRVEVRPPNEQPFPDPARAAPVDRDERGRLAGSEAAKRLAKLPRRGRYVPRAIACDASFASHNARRVDWTRERLAELAQATGGASRGVGAMVNAAGWLYAAGECAAERAATTGDVEGFKLAAQLTATARQHDLAAWELAVRESASRPRQPAPWRQALQPAQPVEGDDDLDDLDDEPDVAERGGSGISRAAAGGGTPPDFSEPPSTPTTPSPPAVQRPAGVALPLVAPFVRSPAHGGALVPSHLARPLVPTQPPADLDAQLARQRADLDAHNRR